MFTANETLKRALAEVGYAETPDNIQKFSQHFGVKVAQWCGYFVDYIVQAAGGKEPKCHYTPAGAEGYRSLHRFMNLGAPKAGDIVFFDFPNDGLDRISHTGFAVKAFPDGSVLCIEGNTSPTEAGDQRNGGCVAVKLRPRKFIVGWGRPHYTPAATPIVDEIVDAWKHNKLPKVYKGALEGKPATKKATPAPAKKTAKKGTK